MANFSIPGGFGDTQDNSNSFIDKYSASDVGPYIGIVKNTIDPLRMGRLGVLLPEKAGVSEDSRDSKKVIWCQYLSPFYGVKPFESVSKNPYNFRENQTAYGMWAVPPDIGTNVLVIFAKGEKTQSSAFWIGCIQEPLTNHMVPGLASNVNSRLGKDKVSPTDYKTSSGNQREAKYGTNVLPVIEKNKKAYNPGENISAEDKWMYPINEDLANQLMRQGLIQDPVRGTTTSSARRETPSRVFGISTPGRLRVDSRRPNIGLEGTQVSVDRYPGHSFTMDDGDLSGDNQLIRLRTASEHQFLMHDRDGIVYIANASGNAWIEMNSEGRIDVYSNGGINLRTEKDFNLHSDTNINFHAGNQIRMVAGGAKEVLYTQEDVDLAEQEQMKVQGGATGGPPSQASKIKVGGVKVPANPGQIITSADYQMHMGKKGIFNTSQEGGIMSYGKSGISSYSPAMQLHGSGSDFHLAGGQVHFNSTGASPSWGPEWLNEEAVGVSPSLELDVELGNIKGTKPLEVGSRNPKTQTTVHRLVTHEPMPRFKGFPTPELIPGLAADDTKQWSKLSTMPGTAEYIAQQNRLSKIESVRDAQYQADAFAFVKAKMGISTDPEKAKEFLSEFGVNYDKSFNIVNQVGNAWDTANSISNKIQNVNLSDTVQTIKNDFTSTISNQIIESVTNKTATMFKDNLFVNQAGQLFSIGQSLHGNISNLKNLKDNAKTIAIDGVKSFASDSVNKYITKKVGASTIGNIVQINQVYKNITAGNITGMMEVTKLASKFGGFGATKGHIGKSLHGTGTPVQGVIMSNIGIAQKAVGAWANKGIKAVSSFFGKGGGGWGPWKSDIRLKEEIQLIGRSQSGINIYRFKYKDTDGMYEGVMAQEVPWAAEIGNDGYYMVDYNKVDVEFRRLN